MGSCNPSLSRRRKAPPRSKRVQKTCLRLATAARLTARYWHDAWPLTTKEGITMKPLNVVIAQVDSKNAERLASTLHGHFDSVAVARSLEELCEAIPRNQADVAVVDLELVSLLELEN